MKSGYSVTFSVEFKQHSNSINVLYLLKEFFNDKGHISFSNKEKTIARYKISNLNDIVNLILPHFENYPLVTSKYLNFLDFKKAILFIKSGEHLSSDGIIKLREIISKMNTNRSFSDKWTFCFNQASNIFIKPEWIQSFSDGEGNFNFHIREKGNSFVCAFNIYQNVHDYHILKLILNYFEAGKIYPSNIDGSFKSAKNFYIENKNKGKGCAISFTINNRELCKEKIIPFFNKYPLFTAKSYDFADWKNLINLADNQIYKTIEGRNEMLKISQKMNTRRFF
jgi:hypothetical protein